MPAKKKTKNESAKKAKTGDDNISLERL